MKRCNFQNNYGVVKVCSCVSIFQFFCGRAKFSQGQSYTKNLEVSHFVTPICVIIRFWFMWCKNYRNWLRFANVVAKSLLPCFMDHRVFISNKNFPASCLGLPQKARSRPQSCQSQSSRQACTMRTKLDFS